jgi:hypothetical protein
MKQPAKHSRPGNVSRRILAILGGVVLFIVVASALALWAVGRFSPNLLDATLVARSGARLVCEENNTNFLVGRLEFHNATVSSPARWKEKSFLKIKTLHLDLSPLSFLGDGPRIIKRAELDVDQLVLVGRGDYMKDNNAQDILRGLKSGDLQVKSAPATDAAPVEAVSARQPFKIESLRVRIGRVKVIVEEPNRAPVVVIDRNFNFVFEANNITDKNLMESLTAPLGQKALTQAAVIAPDLMMDITDRKLRRSITEKILREAK